MGIYVKALYLLKYVLNRSEISDKIKDNCGSVGRICVKYFKRLSHYLIGTRISANVYLIANQFQAPGNHKRCATIFQTDFLCKYRIDLCFANLLHFLHLYSFCEFFYQLFLAFCQIYTFAYTFLFENCDTILMYVC